ncbi:uncharacterized protein LOC111435159 [Cucurbita moschata]|uniref:Uncharacterized protein LOC111435159 n=1 Tax=Cucurbita moschata TaxID=3662 RepID=A0A6J1EJW3_CUCMO|nr:uncharacterized protein LOC111435159 [Cucurbita moschata]XP_022928282.1 uncharacterized protein LOC111435159 [Cucurbita moschata]XP_022928283.1 uncharacterized protein LOC111435159 [Cucurbita moschata]XP_022928284.1 uncharacterized protein LOC111435159 [Cucurbita moschata]
MVLGLKGKHRRGEIVHADYRIHVQDIKPWPPSQSLTTLRSVFIQWENGDRHSGSTNLVIPTIGSIVGEGKIEFNESFKLSVALVRDIPVRGKDGDTFQRNILEFNLFESRREKTAKGQLLASATVDLAEFGVVREVMSVAIPVHCQRNFKNTLQPMLSIKIQPIYKGQTNNSLKDTLSRKMSLDSFDGESVSASDYGDPNKIASFTDDDVSSHSSMTTSSALEPDGCVPPTEEGGLSTSIHGTDNRQEHASISNLEPEKSNMTPENGKHGGLNLKSSSSSSIELSSDPGSPENCASISNSRKVGSVSIDKTGKKSYTVYYSSPPKHEQHESDIYNHGKVEVADHLAKESNGRKLNGRNYQEASNVETEEDGDDYLSARQGDTVKQIAVGSDAVSSIVQKNDRLKHVKSVRSPHSDNSLEIVRRNERRDPKPYTKDTKNSVLDSKVQQLQNKIKKLEGELREAAAIEAALYSIVAEHGSSMNKVHAPARRLSRLYLHSCRESSQSRKADAARSVVSGFVLIAKACGNDVPRLTFWLSNSIVLRTIVSQDAVSLKTQVSSGSHSSKNDANWESSKAASTLKWKAASPNKRENGNGRHGSSGDWEDIHTFTSALEKVEAWIFSRIIESIWWQTLTPHMQSASANTINQVSSPSSGKSYKRNSSSVNHDQGNFSLDLWKKAFKDACERICPVRAEGHECGCLPLLSRLIMEQCVARLDTAMFNAILRDSADEIPTDPVSDPISESKVLPIPVGKSSFGAGALLKNAIGNWSRWLTDLFGLDDDDQCDENNNDEGKDASTLKSFHLLNALSDLMMLPKDMLLSQSVRKEVCPSFSAPVIKTILEHFVPDEFCEDPIPDAVLEALDIEEDPSEVDDNFVTSLPHTAASVSYHPPSVASVVTFIGEVGTKPELRRSGSSVLRKSNTSDDELDELSSPFASILDAAISPSTPASRTSPNATRYDLLRDVWGE